MPKEPKITIDGCELTATEGRYILEVARENGIHIPSLCYHPRLRSTGACRVCVVEIEGGRALMPACATPVDRDGMLVHTRNERVSMFGDHTLSRPGDSDSQDRLLLVDPIIPSAEG